MDANPKRLVSDEERGEGCVIFVPSKSLNHIEHEFRTPLNSIHGLLELIQLTKSDVLPESHLEQLSVVYASSLLLSDRIEELLLMIRIKLGKLKMTLMPIDVSALQQSLQHFFDQNHRSNITLEWHIDPRFPLPALTDNKKVFIILEQLLKNAMTFIKTGKVTISFLETTDPDFPILFQVSDTGYRIDLEHIEEIFTPFYQIEDSIKREHSGLGLGLTIAKDLSEYLGGKLEVRSRYGLGSVFSLYLPKAPCCLVDESYF